MICNGGNCIYINNMTSESRGSSKPCACKGIRSCLLCERDSPSTPRSVSVTSSWSADTHDVKDRKEATKQIYVYCHRCRRAHIAPWTATPSLKDVINHAELNCSPSDSDLPLQGIHLFENFISADEEKELCDRINCTAWVVSQSGRRKQDYGPKVNFKRKKVKLASFSGLPSYSEPFIQRMLQLPQLSDFTPVELCNLEYSRERGSAIDAHFDDFWLWGERLLTINMVSDTVYTMTNEGLPRTEILIHFPRFAFIVMMGEARYEWKHAIQRTHVAQRRMATTIRELTPEFLPGGKQEDVGREILDLALTYKGRAVGSAS
ncbi:hypothetical protein CAPTEDRAFT_150134 [Capitella teleta]|uniref:Fe2OG dioxygenase domain-containing protein n=1 Tax=Capitella teleta TaxID=283909 RepID=R7UQ80_CAPTE|nr:hypothetical protein CAPTEDRAFT_150134 [Capitella teleta]|eukprot:ELU08273.1 hypothetical protein CAPTEDRAFT_150134 [Capitella teleta]